MSLDDRLSSLAPAQRELFAVLRRKKEAARRPEPPPLAPRPAAPADHPWPLAIDQERLWFLHQLDPADTAFNLGLATRLDGQLDPPVLVRCLTEVVRRHEAWRTTFPERDGRPVQVVAPPSTVPLPLLDLSGLPEERRDAEARTAAQTALRLPFDLARGPLLRAWLIRHAPSLHECGLAAHHIVTDGYSSQIFWTELAVLYPAFAAGRPAPLSGLPVQFADFALWQRASLDGETLQEHLEYWTRHLAGAPLVLDLPTDRPRPAHATTRGRRVPLALGVRRTAALKALAQRHQATPFMVILALYQLLLARQAGQERVIVGAPNLNRNRPELHQLLGFFLTQSVFCTDLGGDPTFPELLERVRQVALGALAHQDLPFGRLVEALRPERDTSRPPVAQVTLLLQEAPAGAMADRPGLWGGLRMIPVDLDPEASASELTLALWDGPEGYGGYLELNADLFDRTTGTRFGEGFLALLDAVLAGAPGPGPVSALPAQSEAVRHQVLREWNDTGEPLDPTPVHERFAAQAARTPDTVAVIDGTDSWTYRELARRATELADHLRRMGLGPEDRVAVRLPRSAELVAALLGVLTAGAAYVPLDPAWPRERVDFMLGDCGAAVVVGPSPPAPLPPPLPRSPGEGRKTFEIEALTGPERFPPRPGRGKGGAGEGGQGGEGSGATDLAYLLYTSGSTGTPKAVGITHQNLSVFLSWSAAVFPELAGGVLFSTSVCFDLSVFEIFGTLTRGGTLIVAENALALPELPAAEKVGLINTVPSALAELLRLGPLPASVRTVSLCGEPFSRHLADAIEARGNLRAVNLYGPTEDTVYSTVSEVPRGETLEPAIGRSIAGSRAYVLDRGLRPVPLGARGELYLAGAGLARGYLGRPELTAERFLPDPVTEIPGERMYRTGDLARWRAAGTLEFLGRADRQVKVRGFRVEPAEIEAALAALPGVADVAVAVQGGRLAAWLVPAEGIAGEALLEAARSALLDRLPRHMIPSLWAHLPALPHTPNGKVDHRALPLPGARGEEESVPPRNPVEASLAAIWAGVLGLPRVGVHDNFFRLGGDSILSIRVVAQAREAGLAVSPRQIFERQTVAELATAVVPLTRNDAAAGESPFPPPDPVRFPDAEEAYPLAPLQAGLLVHGLRAPATEVYFEQIVCTLRGALDAVAFRRAWQSLVDRHGVLRTAFAWEGLDRPLQVVHRGVEIPWTEEDWRADGSEARLAAFAAAERRRPFDLRRAPLLRVALLRTGEREHRLVWSFHHLILDGWSLPALFAELFALYRGEILPPPVLPYRDFIAWLERRDRAADERYWRQALAGIDGPTPLPWDRAAPPAGQAGDFTLHVYRLSADATADLEAAVRQRGLTPNTLLQGAWALLLARWSGTREVIFGAVAAGRPPELPGFETALGLFINTLPARVGIAPEQPAAAWLAALQGRQSEARQHEHASLAEIQAWSGVPAREPLFESLLAFENYPLDAALAAPLGGLAVTDLQASERTSFPLSLAALPGPHLRLQLTHDRRLDPTTGARLLGWLTRLLEACTATLDRPLDTYDPLSPAERHQILREWNDSPAPRPAGHALRRFEHWAMATPDAPAVRDAHESLTFAELDRRAERYAAELRAQGVGPESRVALPAERLVALLVGLLGIWKAGAAWVPIDPAHPRERTEEILRDIGAGRPSPPAPLPRAGEGCRLVEESPQVSEPSNPHPSPACGRGAGGEGSAAYVLYTSGSTGTPKGVVVDHPALAGYLAWVEDVLLAPIGFALPATTSLTFDASLVQVLGPLLAGREVRLVPESLVLQPAALTALLTVEGFAAFNAVPALWSAMLDAVEAGEALAPTTLRRLFLGGEAFSPTLLERTWRTLPDLEIWNLYGPTEATGNATAAVLHRTDPSDPTDRSDSPPIPLGRPLPGAQAYVLTPDARLALPGGTGELHLAGTGLARGYLGRPALTAERFVPDPFSATPGGRLYRTGDLVRCHANGLLEHRGRTDAQVKVRGVRLELGEIEAVLRRHPDVREAVVTAAVAAGTTRLDAWVTPVPGTAPDAAGLRSWLRDRLPAAAVPMHFTALADLPRLPNGKLDRRALAAGGADGARPYEPPAGSTEEALAGLWREILETERVGRGDNFFDLGGHSLLATQLMVRIHGQFGLEIPLSLIFEAADLAGLAAEIAARASRQDQDDKAELMNELEGLSEDQIESLLAALPRDEEPA